MIKTTVERYAARGLTGDTLEERAENMTTADALVADPRHVARVVAMARKAGRRHPALVDEFESAAMLALVEASRSFDPSRGVPFHVHLANRVRGTILDAQRAAMPSGYRRKYQRARLREIHETVPIDATADERGHSYADLVADPRVRVAGDLVERDAVEDLARGLPTAYRSVILSYYADELTLKQAGARLGLSESRASQLHARALTMISERLNGRLPEPSTVGPDDILPAEPPARNVCPRCGKPVGDIRKRCYACNPRKPTGDRRRPAARPRPVVAAAVSPAPSAAATAPAWALVVRDLVDLGTVGPRDASGLEGAYWSALALCCHLRGELSR